MWSTYFLARAIDIWAVARKLPAMMRHIFFSLIGVACCMVQSAHARDQIRIVGSSTVFPFVAAAAEQFGKDEAFRTPIVESTGTGGGFAMFCSGHGENTPDMANASRPIKLSEIELCKKNGVNNIGELKLGYDGIVLANARGAVTFKLTKEQLFLALAKEVPQKGKLVANPYTRWNEIDKSLPKLPIMVYGPPPTSGTRDAFAELVLEKTCEGFPEFEAVFPDKDRRKAACLRMREDGKFIEAGENDNLIVQKLVVSPEALGIFGYNFLEQNASLVKANPIDGAVPSVESILDGSYRVARSLFTYVKLDHVGKITGLKEFIGLLSSKAAIGQYGFLIIKGLLPLTESEQRITERTAHDLIRMDI